MRAYYAAGSNQSGSATKTLVNVIASTSVRPRVRQIHLGNSQTPGDQAASYWPLQLHTAVGTAGSSPTPRPVDPSDPAAIATAGAGHSSEPTYSYQVWSLSLHMRASYLFRCEPGFEFVAPATANNGLGLQLVAATTTLVSDGVLYWTE